MHRRHLAAFRSLLASVLAVACGGDSSDDGGGTSATTSGTATTGTDTSSGTVGSSGPSETGSGSDTTGTSAGTETTTDTTTGGQVDLVGFAINGDQAGDRAGYSVAGAGDIDGDGLVDLVVGAPKSTLDGPSAGRAYVVFGKPDMTDVELADVAGGAGGFAIVPDVAEGLEAGPLAEPVMSTAMASPTSCSVHGPPEATTRGGPTSCMERPTRTRSTSAPLPTAAAAS